MNNRLGSAVGGNTGGGGGQQCCGGFLGSSSLSAESPIRSMNSRVQ